MAKVYVLLWPQDMDVDEAENHHVIEAEWDPVREELTFPYGSTALDGRYRKKRNARIGDWQILGEDECARLKLAAKQNESTYEICGSCVSHLYADNNKA